MPKSLKILFVGFDLLPKATAGEYFKVWPAHADTTNTAIADEKNNDGINLFDYHIVVINDRKDYPQSITTHLHSFLADGGLACIFASKNNVHLLNNYFTTKPTEIGTSITPLNNKNWLSKLLSNPLYKFQWSVILDKGQQYANMDMYRALASMQAFYGKDFISLPPQYQEIALAPNNKCICAIAKTDNGKLIALPYPCLMNKELLRNLIESIKNEYYTDKTTVDADPIWLNTMLLPSETEKSKQLSELRSELDAKSEEYLNYTKSKKILYTTGDALSKSVFDVLLSIGFTSTYAEHKGQHDIEIKYKEFTGIIEVKGLSGYASVDDVRQLLDWYIDSLKTDRCVKGIFIVNHYRNIEPSERKEPFSASAVNLAENNKFCLMTTFDLFTIYCDYLSSRIDINGIYELINNTNGILNRSK